MRWVDPRVCGGAIGTAEVDSDMEGRSPRVRGSLLRNLEGGRYRGSIPACAGEPVPIMKNAK